MRNASTQNQNHQNQARNPHYENIYESIDQFGTAPAPAENLPNAQLPNANNTGRINSRTRNNFHYNASSPFPHPRNGAYDVPRQARSYYASNLNTVNRSGDINRRATLESNLNRVRYANRATVRQRSFDDTESYHYSHNNNFRYENIYEQIREEPIYRNIGLNRDSAANRLYGRLDVIGHGIGRIERHLSSSCGNIDHYNLGGTYAILGHSHLSTVGHVYASNNAKETVGKSLNLFSCLGRENSQSMSNICPESSNGNAQEAGGTAAQPPPQPQPPQNENVNKPTGTIPKIKVKAPNAANNNTAVRNTAQNPVHSTALNRISKSSLQWLLMNKWLPLWIGNGSDCNMLDFNFMFSRNCDGCERDDDVVVYDESNSVAYANGYREFAPENHYTVSRPRCYHNSLMRFNQANPHRMYRSNRRPNYRPNETENGGYDVNDMPYNYRATPPPPENPFRRWELSENNSFRPASVRRITDGTFPNGNHQNGNYRGPGANTSNPSGDIPNQGGGCQEVRVEINNQPVEACASTSSAASSRPVPSTSSNTTNNAATPSRAHLRLDRRTFENGALSSSTESASENENKVRSPDLSGRRYSENTEDDQYNSGNSSCTDDDGNDETISELNTDNSERINDQSN